MAQKSLSSILTELQQKGSPLAQKAAVIALTSKTTALETSLASYPKTADLSTALLKDWTTESVKFASASDVSGLQTDVSGLKTDVNGLKTGVSGLQTDVNGLKTGVSGLQTDVNNIEGILNLTVVPAEAVQGV